VYSPNPSPPRAIPATKPLKLLASAITLPAKAAPVEGRRGARATRPGDSSWDATAVPHLFPVYSVKRMHAASRKDKHSRDRKCPCRRSAQGLSNYCERGPRHVPEEGVAGSVPLSCRVFPCRRFWGSVAAVGDWLAAPAIPDASEAQDGEIR
jgi:hypothetical protein